MTDEMGSTGTAITGPPRLPGAPLGYQTWPAPVLTERAIGDDPRVVCDMRARQPAH